MEILMWFSVALNLTALLLSLRARHNFSRLRKKLELREAELENRERLCATMTHACTEFLESTHEREDLTSEEK